MTPNITWDISNLASMHVARVGWLLPNSHEGWISPASDTSIFKISHLVTAGV